jgi:transcriptional regulator with XRE-family HTH domain
MDVIQTPSNAVNFLPEELEQRLGEQLRALRIRAELDQVQLAALAGVGLSAVKSLESGKGSTLKTLVRVVRALGCTSWLDALAPQVSVSPLQLMRATAAAEHPRQRVSRSRRPPSGD